MNKIFILAIIAFLAGVIFGFLNTRGPKWQDYPSAIIVDTNEEFNRKNTP